MTTLVFEVTVDVLMVKLALLAPPATVTLAGTMATDVFALDRVTTAPPEGAAPLSVTVPVDVLPPTTVEGLRETPLTVGGGAGGGVMVSTAACEMFSRPQIFSCVLEETEAVVMVKFALVAPAGIVTLAGTEATPRSVES